MVEIARDMRRLEPETRKAVRPRLRRAGQAIAGEAQRNASWSSRIPGTVRVVTSFRANREGVTVRAGGNAAPHARPYEGITARGDSFRHPVYGNDWWVASPTRPFLLPAVQAKQAEADTEVRATLDDAATKLGFN
jgi:hypothetical protein